jgi:hypothetical protein
MAVRLIKTTVKKTNLNYWKRQSFYLGKISVYLPNTIQVPCLGWDQEQTPALHNPDYDFPDIITTGYLFSTI